MRRSEWFYLLLLQPCVHLDDLFAYAIALGMATCVLYVMCKVLIRTIHKLYCASVGSELCPTCLWVVPMLTHACIFEGSVRIHVYADFNRYIYNQTLRWSQVICSTCTYTRTHTHTTHTHTHTHTYTRTHTRTHARTCTHTHMHIHTPHTHTHAHAI